MKAKDIVEIFSKFDPNEEIAIEWWEKNLFVEVLEAEERVLSNEDWIRVVAKFDKRDTSDIHNWLLDETWEESQEVNADTPL